MTWDRENQFAAFGRLSEGLLSPPDLSLYWNLLWKMGKLGKEPGDWFEISNQELMGACKICSKGTFSVSREYLSEMGFIVYTNGVGRRHAKYMLPLLQIVNHGSEQRGLIVPYTDQSVDIAPHTDQTPPAIAPHTAQSTDIDPHTAQKPGSPSNTNLTNTNTNNNTNISAVSIANNNNTKASKASGTKSKHPSPAPPSLGEVKAYIAEKKLSVNADDFFAYYEAGNWHDSRGCPVQNWRQKLLTWQKFDGGAHGQNGTGSRMGSRASKAEKRRHDPERERLKWASDGNGWD